MRRMLPLFIAISVMSMVTPLQADTLEMPAGTPAATQPSAGYSVNLPGRGMTMTQVEEKFGPPLQKLPEVGDPPIIRWIYPDYTVYFEYQYVINSVLNAPSAPAPQPMPTEPMAPAEMPPMSETTVETIAPVEPPPSEDPVAITPEVEIIPAPAETLPADAELATPEAEGETPQAEMAEPPSEKP